MPYFLKIGRFDIFYIFFYLAAIAQVWINLHRQHISYTVMFWKGKSHVAKEKSGRGRRRSREKGYQGVEDFRFITFIIFSFLFFSILYFIVFFYTLFTPCVYPHPRPTTFSYTRSRLTDLISKKTNCTCSTRFLLISKKQICTCSTHFCLSLAVVLHDYNAVLYV